MISRYALYDTSLLSTRYDLSEGLPKGVKPNYNIGPTMSAPVIVNQNGTRIAKLMKWGLVAKGAKDMNSVFRYKTYDIPSEKIFSKPTWVQAIRQDRCLVPANGFYDLTTTGEKRAMYTRATDGSLLVFAGVYSLWQDPDGIEHDTFSLLTTSTVQSGATGSGRMPAIIQPEDEKRWLDPTITDALSTAEMLRPYPEELLTTYEVSPAVHSPKSSQPSLVEHIS